MAIERDAKGRVLKGSSLAKKDMTKELAKNMVSKEMWFIAKLLADSTAKEVQQMLSSEEIELSILGSLFIEKIARKKDVKVAQWFTEMMIGKATQQTEIVGNDGDPVMVKYVQDN